MRQRSAPDFSDDSLTHQFKPATTRPASGSLRPRAHRVAPRLSLPQRPLIVDSTLADEPTEAPPPTKKRKHARRPSTQALAVHSAPTSPLDLPEPASPADLQLIPRTSPAIPAASIKQSWFHKSSPRMTIIKLSLIGLVVCSVLVATLATAGGGRVTNFIFSALESAIPFTVSQPASSLTIAQRVKPITQADPNAGYDSPQQHDIWWNSACSAAVMTEILHAWGITNVTIGQIIDEMSAANPPYITPWGGLMSQNGWNYIMSGYHLQATVHLNHSMSYDDIVRMTVKQGLPVVLGLRDNGGVYFPAFAGGGHFLIAVGGDSAGLNIVDSSLYRIKYLPYNELNYLWTGETVVITR